MPDRVGIIGIDITISSGDFAMPEGTPDPHGGDIIRADHDRIEAGRRHIPQGPGGGDVVVIIDSRGRSGDFHIRLEQPAPAHVVEVDGIDVIRGYSRRGRCRGREGIEGKREGTCQKPGGRGSDAGAGGQSGAGDKIPLPVGIEGFRGVDEVARALGEERQIEGQEVVVAPVGGITNRPGSAHGLRLGAADEGPAGFPVPVKGALGHADFHVGSAGAFESDIFQGVFTGGAHDEGAAAIGVTHADREVDGSRVRTGIAHVHAAETAMVVRVWIEHSARAAAIAVVAGLIHSATADGAILVVEVQDLTGAFDYGGGIGRGRIQGIDRMIHYPAAGDADMANADGIPEFPDRPK
ncbi:hypothetical protein DAPPUDRAFT_124101 [Daphnia pulex]|uniref:Uncharacterized protein n=1 Tax=Daphnia pulex TaxID=6669 RepID=E9I6C0_DAPPU|nr:hypothetical protein DAPPUDRAFT_124101 [Daphnia pulex]|eukprot:EFX60460.1 hypothetical protein DAPPUDRAFT_124101 [Daphnia pulex]